MPNPFGQFPGDDDLMPRRGTRTKAAAQEGPVLRERTTNKASQEARRRATKKDTGDTGSTQVLTRYCADSRGQLHRLP